MANPQEVVDLIYACATKDRPVHNAARADKEMILGMKNTLSQQEFIDRMGAMMLPKP